MLRAVAFCTRAYVKFKSSGTVVAEASYVARYTQAAMAICKLSNYKAIAIIIIEAIIVQYTCSIATY